MTDDAPLLLDVTRLIWRRWRGRAPTGIDRVALAYLRHFGPRAQAVVNHDRFRRILDFHASQKLFALLQEPGDWFKQSLVLGALANLRHLAGSGRHRPYLNVGHTGLNSPGFMNWLGAADLRPIYFVHDLIPITHPQYCRPGEDEHHRIRMLTVLRTASGIIGNSHATLRELADFARSQGLDMPRSVAAWLGSEPFPVSGPEKPPTQPTFLTVGTIEGRKNHILLLNLWSRLIDRLGSEAPRLLIIGERGWEAEPVFQLLDNSDNLRGHVVEINHCSDADLARYLATSRALLFPSLAEGYGLPLIEALRTGLPVIASDLPALREIGGDIPTYLNPRDEESWEAAILDYVRSDSNMRAAQISRMRGFHAPDWTTHFQTVDAWLEDLS